MMQQSHHLGRKNGFTGSMGKEFNEKALGNCCSFNALVRKHTATMMNDDQNRRNKNISGQVCNKPFRSLSFGSGHMRSHSNRVWRETQHLEALLANRMSTSSLDDLSEDIEEEDDWSETAPSPVDLLKHLPWSWSNTGKRFRKNSVVATAADYPINLSRGLEGSGNFQNQIVDPPLVKKLRINTVSGKGTLLKISPTYDHQEDIMVLKPRKVITEHCNVSGRKRKKMCLAEKKRNGTASSSSTETDETLFLKGIAAETRKNIDVATKRCKCISCGKSFPTYQALGGHRSIHTKKTRSMAEKKNTNSASSSIALPTELARLSPESTSSSTGNEIQGGQAGPRLLDFDLNNLPFGMP